jgi:gamma-glutamyltranspeptidase/glutathione hydrolase
MNPVVATRDGKPWLALGGRGGRRIPNAAIVALAGMFLEGRRLDPALAAPRLHTEGTLALGVEKSWPADDAESLRKLGYRVLTQPSAVLSAVAREDGKLVAAMR